jgi:hypothetical protein
MKTVATLIVMKLVVIPLCFSYFAVCQFWFLKGQYLVAESTGKEQKHEGGSNPFRNYFDTRQLKINYYKVLKLSIFFLFFSVLTNMFWERIT